jgi:PIN domain nuclease of toxin-antitoxin system
MRLLLDTQLVLWSCFERPRLNQPETQLIMAADEINVSTLTIWEASIKFALVSRGARKLPFSGEATLREVEAAGFNLLDFKAAHATEVDRLPLHHGDPFDRGMLAQARVEGLTFLTRDAALERYGHPVRLV